jgi:uncharacterized membrane-anchored protein
MISARLRNWLTASIIISTFIMVFLPGVVASGLVKKTIVGVLGGLSIVLQLILISKDRNSHRTQSYIFLALTVIAFILMMVLYSK